MAVGSSTDHQTCASRPFPGMGKGMQKQGEARTQNGPRLRLSKQNPADDPKPLSSEEICDLFEHMNQISETAMRRLVLQDLRALQNFEQSSGRLTKVLIGLTGVVLTIVIAGCPILAPCFTQGWGI